MTDVHIETEPEEGPEVHVEVPVEVNVEPEGSPEPPPADMNEALELVERMRETADEVAAGHIEGHHRDAPHEAAVSEARIREIAREELDALLEEPEITTVAPDVADLEEAGEHLADAVSVVTPDVENEPPPEPTGWMRTLKRIGW